MKTTMFVGMFLAALLGGCTQDEPNQTLENVEIEREDGVLILQAEDGDAAVVPEGDVDVEMTPSTDAFAAAPNTQEGTCYCEFCDCGPGGCTCTDCTGSDCPKDKPQ